MLNRDSRRADSYHTCYTLAGLSSVQHVHYYLGEDASGSNLAPPFRWRCLPLSDLPSSSADGVFDQQDTLQPFHPVFVIPHEAAQSLRDWAERQRRTWPVDIQK